MLRCPPVNNANGAGTTVRDHEQMQNTKYSVNENYKRVHHDPGRINYVSEIEGEG